MINAKERKVIRVKKRKGIEAQSVYPLTPSWATDALIGEEDQNGKQKTTKRKKPGAGLQPNYAEPFSPSYDAQGSYGEPI